MGFVFLCAQIFERTAGKFRGVQLCQFRGGALSVRLIVIPERDSDQGSYGFRCSNCGK